MKKTYFDRDQSWLGFNGRILDETADPEVPLLERFRFLSIYSSNLDEFYGVLFPDWMNRSVYHRIEVCAPVKDPDARAHIKQCIRYWKEDNHKAVWLGSDLEI